MDDAALLRRYEPIARFTKGERFFPMDADRYIECCALWMKRPQERPQELVPRGQLTIDRLVEPRHDGFSTVYYLKFVEPLTGPQLLQYTSHRRRDFRPARGRLARVGLLGRFVDVIFAGSLLLRGRVSGATAAAAVQAYERIRAADPRYCYYGRVVREGGYVCLQYWFFYAMNDYRSGFNGVNDHEADLEMLAVYLSAHDLRPLWVAATAHEAAGDDLRRRWDDPHVEKVGEHPVIYVGAGSHAGYFLPGEYLAEIEVRLPAPVTRALDAGRRVWLLLSRQGRPEDDRPRGRFLRVPFIDYARGDGLAIGPGQRLTWELLPLEPGPRWVDEYRGLWGLYVEDLIAGEDAPAGPKYNRDGTVRRSWYDPLGWAGLDKVVPPAQAPGELERARAELAARRAALALAVQEKAAELGRLGLEVEAMAGHPHLRPQYQERRRRLETVSRELAAMRATLANDQALAETLEAHRERLARGDFGPPRAHLRHLHLPSTPREMRLGRLAEAWAALSTGVLLVGFVALYLMTSNEESVIGLLAMLGVIALMEALFRRQVQRLIGILTNTLAVLATLVLLYEFYWLLIIVLATVASLVIIVDNVRELRA